MYFIRNIPRKTILCYRDGSRITYATEETAKPHMEYAKHITGEEHDIIHIMGPVMPLGRIIAPWIRTYPTRP